jgi:hypothetical protein
MRTFTSIMDFTQSAVFFDLSFQFVILYLLTPVCILSENELLIVSHLYNVQAEFQYILRYSSICVRICFITDLHAASKCFISYRIMSHKSRLSL